MSRARPVLIALGISLALAVLLTWPAVLDLRGSMVGHPGNDTWNHAWGFWWIQDGLRQGTFPMTTMLLDHPRGGSLFFIDSFNAVLTAPLSVLLGVPFAYNVVVLAAFTLNAFGAWALARRELQDDVIAWVPAVVFASSAHLLGQAYNGISETLNAGFLPLYVLALLRLLDRPSWRRAVVMGALLGVCSIANFYYGLFGIVLSVVIVIHRGLSEWRRTGWGRFVLATAGAGALYAVLVLPVLRLLSRSIDAENAMVNRDPEFVWASLINHNITDVVSFLRPGSHYSPDLKALYGEDLLIVIYLGWAALTLAVVGLALTKPRKGRGLWATIAVVFLVFSLGPYLHVGGEYVELAGRRVPLPFLVFFEAFPLFSRISHPFRFVVPATLGLGMLAGLGVQGLIRRLPERIPKVAPVAVACGLVLAEILLASPAPWPLPRCDADIPEVYAELEGEGAVLDLPITVPNLERAVYTWYQTAHQHPSPYGLNDPVPDALERNPLTALLVQVEASRAMTLPRMLPELELVAGADMLREQGYSWIVVHEALYPSHKRALVGTVLEGLLGEPQRVGQVAVYSL